MICEKSETCPIYNELLPMETGLGAMYAREYCQNNKDKCARYMVATTLGKEFVPMDLWPNMTEQAKKILAEHAGK